jgi:tetratricopeptide (TPR) repeat protein
MSENLIMLKITLGFICIFSFIGCSTTSEIEVLSDPKSKVYIGDDFLSETKEVGVTPFKLNPKMATEKDFLFLTFENKKFEKQKLVIPKNFSGGRIQVKLSPKEKISDKEIEERILDRLKKQHVEDMLRLKNDYQYDVERLKKENTDYYAKIEKEFNDKSNMIYRMVLSFQSALQMEDLNTANRYLLQLRKINAPASLMLILEGNYQYFNKEYKEAIVSYEKSLELNPDNIEMIPIIQKLKEMK